MEVLEYGFYRNSSLLSVYCPHRKAWKIGSVACQDCEHLSMICKDSQRVECNYKDIINKQDLKLFVWTEFCTDYTEGLAFAIANTQEEAMKLIEKHSGVEIDNWGKLEILPLDSPVARQVWGGG